MKIEPWTIKQLFEAHERDIAQCRSDLERSNVTAITGREIREKAVEWAARRKADPDGNGYRATIWLSRIMIRSVAACHDT